MTGLGALRRVTENPVATEFDIQEEIERNSWIFGGRFVDVASRRRLVVGDEVDIPLIRNDGSLHIVELKRAIGVKSLIKRHRGSLVPTAEVHDATAQAINYLVNLDESRSRILAEFGIDTRRSSATIPIGHPLCNPDVEEAELNEIFRIASSHLNRVEVRTYKDILDAAENSHRVTTLS